MSNEKKKGILLIIIGICIPLFALPFVSGFDIHKGFMDNFYNTGIRITKDQSVPAPAVHNSPPVTSKGSFDFKRMRIEKIPYRLFFVPTFLLIYIGIVLIDRDRKRLSQPKA